MTTPEYILIDNHHADLTHSLELLFGKRLGYRVVYPVGMEWYEKGFWKVYPHPDTARQFLGLNRADNSVHSRDLVLTGSGYEKPDKDLYYCYDHTKDIYERGVTLQKFAELPCKYIVASIPAHVACFEELRRAYKPSAKLIFQMGNTFSGFDFKGVKNVMNSTDRRLPFFMHSVRYSQEFSLDLFRYEPPRGTKRVTNLTHYAEEKGLYRETKAILKQFKFESYGAGNEDGNITKRADVALKMIDSDFIWNLKKVDDGYGHVVHNAAACGRPVIISSRHYKTLRFGRFIEDRKTCICVDGLSARELADKILHYSEPERLLKMSRRLYERFRNEVSFEKDAARVKLFLKRLR